MDSRVRVRTGARLLIAIAIVLSTACGTPATRSGGGKPAAGSPQASIGASSALPGTIGSFRLYPVAMDYDDQAKTNVTFGEGFRQYRVNLIFVNSSAKAVNLTSGPNGFFVKDEIAQQPGGANQQLLGMSLVSADPYTYTHFTGDLDVPAASILPPGFSSLIATIFFVAVTAHPPFRFMVQAGGQSVTVPLQARPTGAAVPTTALSTPSQPLRTGGLQVTLTGAGPSSVPDSTNAGFVLAGDPGLRKLPWLKASWSLSNPGGQADYASFSSYLITDSSGYLHPGDVSSPAPCCPLNTAQTQALVSFWAMRPAETGPAYVVLLAVRSDGTAAVAAWKVQ